MGLTVLGMNWAGAGHEEGEGPREAELASAGRGGRAEEGPRRSAWTEWLGRGAQADSRRRGRCGRFGPGQ